LYARNGVFFVDQPTVVLRKFPSMELGFPSRQIGRLPLYLSGETSMTSLARSDAGMKTPTFVERLDLHPILEIPIVHSSVIDWSNRVGFRETAYTHSRDNQTVLGDALNRLSFEYSSRFVGPQLQRDFGNWRHLIEPSVNTRYVGGANEFANTIVVDDI